MTPSFRKYASKNTKEWRRDVARAFGPAQARFFETGWICGYKDSLIEQRREIKAELRRSRRKKCPSDFRKRKGGLK